MVYITSWDEFVDRSVQLFRADPESTRYVMKYRHCDGKLVLKVTDNREEISNPKPHGSKPWALANQPTPHGYYFISLPRFLRRSVEADEFGLPRIECLKFKTDQAQDAKKMEKLNNVFFTLMARGPEVDTSEVTGKEQTDAQPTKKRRGRKQ
ncbi:Signal recognition particle, SRP9/SRP14 subunit [Parasponia andersonii]|uniref:Signal recognition particle, SRP9/SRP14 subunit n=1 Tax=Parasponia andersonii TaxID=3476 RepID=A0A2P5AN55_PARAD|nr:Signal recognition particle, SRP9/SRP14 subunit [Parasponia andersonii]